jgi:hypothetical protein
MDQSIKATGETMRQMDGVSFAGLMILCLKECGRMVAATEIMGPSSSLTDFGMKERGLTMLWKGEELQL